MTDDRAAALAQDVPDSPGRSAGPSESEDTMARFMDVHTGFIGVTAQQLQEAHEADQAIEGDEGMHFEKAWLDPETGKVFCLSTGPSKEAVMRIHERAGHPTAEVYEIPI